MKKNLMIAMILVSAVLVASLFFIPKLNAGESNCGDYDVTCPGDGGCDCDYGTEGDVYVGEVAPGVYVCNPACGLGTSCVQGQCVTQNILSIRERTGFASVSGTGTQIAVKSVDTVTGVADVVVKYADGRLETVTAAADGSARLASGEQIQVRAIERGLFRRGANVEINVVSPGGTGVGASAGVLTGHTHLVDYEYVTKSLDQTHITPTQIAFRNKIGCTEEFGSDYVVLGGGFDLFSEESTKDVKVFANHPDDGGTSYNVYVIADEPTLSGNPMMYATCARLEQAIDSGEPHF